MLELTGPDMCLGRYKDRMHPKTVLKKLINYTVRKLFDRQSETGSFSAIPVENPTNRLSIGPHSNGPPNP